MGPTPAACAPVRQPQNRGSSTSPAAPRWMEIDPEIDLRTRLAVPAVAVHPAFIPEPGIAMRAVIDTGADVALRNAAAQSKLQGRDDERTEENLADGLHG